MTATLLADDTLQILSAYGRGIDIRDIPKATGLPLDLVRTVVSCDAGHDRTFARHLVQEHDTAQRDTAAPTEAPIVSEQATTTAAAPGQTAASSATHPAGVVADPRAIAEELSTDDLEEEDVVDARPRIVALCGSSLFRHAFLAASRALTLAGAVVLAPSVFGLADGREATDAEKAALDALDQHTIDLADEVIVVSPGGYVDDSTRQNIVYAQVVGKPVSYMDETTPPGGPVPGGPPEGVAHPAPASLSGEAPLRSWTTHLCQACSDTSPTPAECCDQPMTPVYVRLHRRAA